MSDHPKENTQFVFDMVEVIKKHYPTGKMPVADVEVYFGMVLIAAIAPYPQNVRDRVARVLAQRISHPPKGLREGLFHDHKDFPHG